MPKPLHILGATLLPAGSLHANIVLYNSTAQNSGGADSLTRGALYDIGQISNGWVIS